MAGVGLGVAGVGLGVAGVGFGIIGAAGDAGSGMKSILFCIIGFEILSKFATIGSSSSSFLAAC